MTREIGKDFEQVKIRLVEKYHQIAEAFGIEGLKKRLLGILFISVGKPVSLTEMTDLSNYSKASVSRAMRELEMEIPLIQEIKKPQDREKYYCIDVNFIDFIAGFLVKTVTDEAEPTLEATTTAVERLDELHARTEDEDLKTEIAEFREQALILRKMYEKYVWFITRILTYMDELEQQWKKKHSNHI